MYEIDRRTAIKWVLGASAALRLPSASFDALAAAPAAQGYGKDPNLLKVYAAGELWPLTLTKEQRATATALCDLIIPADDTSPAASSVGVVDFIDEWISAPYPEHAVDRKTVLDGLSQIEGEAQRRFKTAFAKLSTTQLSTIADAMVKDPFFERYRALTAGGFYTTPVGVKDLKYVGNVAMATFEGPTQDVLKRLGLA
ncbi:MAG TPA: gluconate 2-dehydrogenase subunit 3 family protein [Steroidobacteraceae bacterium]|jgi:gluconate 2-dehydrogenase subunit 3-like protein|nr:gluconate 2-dehydrogenase subunit 3 family protein [Steroidobacteraceae bacterium]